LNKIREFLPPASDERALLAAQRVAIFGYDPCAEIHSNRIVQEGGTSGQQARSVDFGACLRAAIAKAKRFADLGELSDDQHQELVSYRGGCACSWPTVSAPCRRCTDELTSSEAEALGWLDDEIELPSWLQGEILDSDRPGISAMAAKNAKPAPEPVFSVEGAQTGEFFSNDELLEALSLIRAKRAPAVKETPRGLMVVREFDHRLGLWGGEGY